MPAPSIDMDAYDDGILGLALFGDTPRAKRHYTRLRAIQARQEMERERERSELVRLEKEATTSASGGRRRGRKVRAKCAERTCGVGTWLIPPFLLALALLSSFSSPFKLISLIAFVVLNVLGAGAQVVGDMEGRWPNRGAAATDEPTGPPAPDRAGGNGRR